MEEVTLLSISKIDNQLVNTTFDVNNRNDFFAVAGALLSLFNKCDDLKKLVLLGLVAEKYDNELKETLDGAAVKVDMTKFNDILKKKN